MGRRYTACDAKYYYGRYGVNGLVMFSLAHGNQWRKYFIDRTGGPVREPPSGKAAAMGFSLVELIIAMALGITLLGAIYSLFTTQNKVLATQNQLVNVQQNARTAMEMMVRDMRLAGSNPTLSLPRCAGTLPASLINTACVGILNAANDVIQFNMDKSSTSGSSFPDGETDGPNETITYGLYACTVGGVSVNCLGRKTRATDSNYRLVADNIQSLSFSYQDSENGSAANIGSIRKITVTLVARIEKYDPSYPQDYGYRTYTLKSQVTPRNLSY